MAATAPRAVRAVLDEYLQRYPEEAAKALEPLPVSEIVRVLQGVPVTHAVPALERLTPDIGAHVLEQADQAVVTSWINAMDPTRAASWLARLELPVRTARLELLHPSIAHELDALMSYPPDSAGRLMDPRVTTLRADGTVKDVRSRLRALKQKHIYDICLVDETGRLVGQVGLQDLLLAVPEEPLAQLVRRAPVVVQATAPREDVAELISQHRLASLPVVDVHRRLLGVIQHDTLVATVEAEASADIQTMVGVSKEERALSAMWFAVRKRLPWLQINLATAFLAAAVVGLFEATIAKFTALAVLLPVVAGQSGNTGAQALAVTMRGLALREVRLRHWPRLSLKEVRVGAINGVAVAAVTALGTYLWSRSAGLSLVIGVAMVLSMAIASLSGAAVPMVLTALRQDPAQASSIILTTITDIVGFASFLGLATVLAHLL